MRVLQANLPKLIAALDAAKPGSYVVVQIALVECFIGAGLNSVNG